MVSLRKIKKPSVESAEIRIESLDKLLREAKKLPDKDKWIFRGVSNRDYGLVPTVGRVRQGLDKEEISRGEEKALLRSFRDKVRPHVEITIENDLEWLALGQHHGLPTRLLDWTRSALVAAYFAANKGKTQIRFENGEKTRNPIDGAIYAVKRPSKVSRLDRENPFDIDKVKLIEPPLISERVSRQVSVLSIHSTPTIPWGPSGLITYIIPMGHKFQMKRDLDRLGINEASLFPGIDAVARHLAWELKWGIKR